MLIHVMYPGNSYDYVKDFILDRLINTSEIVKFRRSSGWVSIESDPVRVENRPNFYNGLEKRAPKVQSAPQSVKNLRQLFTPHTS